MNPLLDVIRRRTGLSLRADRTTSLESFVSTRASTLHCGSVDAYASRLKAEPLSSDEWRRLVAAVSNGHTAFFRDFGQLQAVMDVVETLAPDRTPHIWSCGCSTGEEAYSLAMLALERGLDVQVTGTDINADALAHAQRGRYSEWSLRRTSPEFRDKYFAREGEQWLPSPDVMASVEFAVQNLCDEAYPHAALGPWDVIVCRNVFIYFEPDAIRASLTRFAQVLRDDGAIFLGHSDLLDVRAGTLVPASLRGRLRYRQQREFDPVPAPRASAARPRPPASPDPMPVPPPPPRPPAHTLPLPDAPDHSLLERVAEQDFAGALEELRRRYDDASAALVNMWRGNLELAQHEFEAASRAYEAAHTADPLNAEVHFLRAVLLRRLGAIEEAVESCRRALFLSPDLWPASFLLASLLSRLGARQRSRAEYEHTLDLLGRLPRRQPLESYLPGLDDLFPPSEDVEKACRFHLRAARA